MQCLALGRVFLAHDWDLEAAPARLVKHLKSGFLGKLGFELIYVERLPIRSVFPPLPNSLLNPSANPSPRWQEDKSFWGD